MIKLPKYVPSQFTWAGLIIPVPSVMNPEWVLLWKIKCSVLICSSAGSWHLWAKSVLDSDYAREYHGLWLFGHHYVVNFQNLENGGEDYFKRGLETGSLLLLKQITTNLAAYTITNVLFCNSGGLKSKMGLTGLKSSVSRAASPEFLEWGPLPSSRPAITSPLPLLLPWQLLLWTTPLLPF